MPKRTDLESILIIGAGPIVIGQACEFDYSGTQACKAIREEGYRVVLVNSNPATIMTDPDEADSTYVEPVEWQSVAKIIEKERPSAVLSTMGGQTALNCVLDLEQHGILAEFGVEVIGARPEVIKVAEDRGRFCKAMDEIGLPTARSMLVHDFAEAQEALRRFAFPLILRPSFTLGGSGSSVVRSQGEFASAVKHGLDLSPSREVLIEESLLGWAEYEMEAVRDQRDNCIIVCSIENVDPMGIHTGDSITVAPALTLTDKEYQLMRNATMAVLRKVGVDTGGSNVQFAVNPETGRQIIVEMNPRVSRSSALASKATGFPIAKVAAKLAVGYTLDELENTISSQRMPASFEPTLDYVVTKVPRFTFEKFSEAEDFLNTQMKSVGEVIAMGRSFKESLQKALCALEIGVAGLDEAKPPAHENAADWIRKELSVCSSRRLWQVAQAFRIGLSVDEVFVLTQISRWFLWQISEIVDMEKDLASHSLERMSMEEWVAYKRSGFSDARLAQLLNVTESAVRKQRTGLGVRPVFKRVDTCAAEFATNTCYMYSTYEEECEAAPSNSTTKIMVLGSGPNRIGQGIEFDYCCVQAGLALREMGYQTLMVNCNPETVSTDYDISDRLYFEPLTMEHVSEIIHVEKPWGVVVQYGGLTPLKLARPLESAGVRVLGTSPDSIDLAEDRERFKVLLGQLGLRQPSSATVYTAEEAFAFGRTQGYPLVVRPSYVLGGRAMAIVHDQEELEIYVRKETHVLAGEAVLLDDFLCDATEIDVDAVCDGEEVLIGGIMQHIEQAGIHSGDSACSLPAHSMPEHVLVEIAHQATVLAKALAVKGLMNMQCAVRDGEIYVLEVNPRASRTVPFVSKVTGLPLAKIAARCMMGQSLASQGVKAGFAKDFFAVKEVVFPFLKFPGVDAVMGPEMKSTGEVMGLGRSFGEAFLKSQIAAGYRIPRSGTVLLSVRDADKAEAVVLARSFLELGFSLMATKGTARALRAVSMECEYVFKVKEGKRPHVVDQIKRKEVVLIVNTTEGRQAIADSFEIRREALVNEICYTTTLAGAFALVKALHCQPEFLCSLQELHNGHE